MRTPFYRPVESGGAKVDDFTGVGYTCGTDGPSGCHAQAPAPLRAAGPMSYNYWFGFVGNVLGMPVRRPRRMGGLIRGITPLAASGCSAGATVLSGEDPYLDGTSGSYIFRHGDYDYYNGSIADWTSKYSQTLPNSFYLASAPAFFSAGASCTYPWPWVTPTGSSSNPGQQLRRGRLAGQGPLGRREAVHPALSRRWAPAHIVPARDRDSSCRRFGATRRHARGARSSSRRRASPTSSRNGACAVFPCRRRWHMRLKCTLPRDPKATRLAPAPILSGAPPAAGPAPAARVVRSRLLDRRKVEFRLSPASLVRSQLLDRRKVEFSGLCHAGGLDAPAGVMRETGGLLPIAPCGRSSL